MMLPRLRAPVVLVHGLFGFAQLRLGPWVLIDYFRGVPQALAEAGTRALVARLSPTNGIAARAEQLRDFIRESSPDGPVHVVAHSMGGLDARHMISRLGMAERVLSLTTLGTPHRGTPFADWGLSRLGKLVGPVFDTLRLPRRAFDDLTVAACKEFNEQTPDVPAVRYFSVAGRLQGTIWRNPSWRLSAPIVEKSEGESDGVVSVRSATWGESLDLWDGDHMALINLPKKPVHPGYAPLFDRLRGCE
jgi:triacylglycerol lipase